MDNNSGLPPEHRSTQDRGAAPGDQQENPPTFEDALHALEETVEELRSDGLNLARALDLYEQGTKLATYCEQVLTAAELRLTRLEPTSGKISIPEVIAVQQIQQYEMEADW